MLPGFPDAPLWIVVTLFIVGAMLLYFGGMSRGRNRVIAMLIGLACVAFAAAPTAMRLLDRNPAWRDCVAKAGATGSLSCIKTL